MRGVRPRIRILRQDSWEALCSFIISQCNNISRIKGHRRAPLRKFRRPDKRCDKVDYTFPSAERLAVLEPEKLACIRSGYRAEYIICAARAVINGEIDLEALKKCDYKQAIKALRSIRGVGEKVANCVVLFGLWHMEAFPIDVWMKRALKENFPPVSSRKRSGSMQGLPSSIFFITQEAWGEKNEI